jgi:hypothetical protein
LEGEYGGNITYTCMKMKKMRPVETILRMGVGRMKKNGGGGESKLYCKHFGKCCNVPPVRQ